MHTWRRRDRAQRVEARAKALIEVCGGDAYTEARKRQGHADTQVTANEWRRVAIAVARMTGKRIGLDTSTRMAMDADFTADLKMQTDQLDELTRIISER